MTAILKPNGEFLDPDEYAADDFFSNIIPTTKEPVMMFPREVYRWFEKEGRSEILVRWLSGNMNLLGIYDTHFELVPGVVMTYNGDRFTGLTVPVPNGKAEFKYQFGTWLYSPDFETVTGVVILSDGTLRNFEEN